MNTTLLDKDVKRYVDAVAAALIDLPEATLAEILEDLAAHLTEFDLADGPLDVQLGDPAAYAQELRASAGFAPPPPPPMGGPQIGAHIRRVGETVRTHRWWRSTRAFLPSLEPAWWVARAWLVVVVMAGANPSDIPIPAPNGNWFVGLVLLAALIPFSVRLGQGAKRAQARHLNRTASALGIVLLLVFFSGVREQQYIYYQSYGQAPQQLLREVPVMLFDMNGEQDTGTRAILTLDERGYMTDSDAIVMHNGLATPVGPCPNGRPYAACLRADTAMVPSTSTAAIVTTTVVPSTTAATVVPSTTVAAPPAPPTSGG